MAPLRGPIHRKIWQIACAAVITSLVLPSHTPLCAAEKPAAEKPVSGSCLKLALWDLLDSLGQPLTGIFRSESADPVLWDDYVGKKFEDKQGVAQNFKRRLKQAFPYSPWRRKLLESIWKDEIENGIYVMDLTKVVTLPAQVSKEVAQGMITIARAHGLSPGKRYVVLPGKLLLSSGIKYLHENVILVLSLGGTGEILDLLAINNPAPLWDNTDPTTLKDDEVIALVKMDATEVRPEDGNVVSLYDGLRMEELQKLAPGKFVVIDLSRTGAPTDSTPEEIIRRTDEQLTASGKKIKRLIFAGHGSPGRVYGDRVDFIEVSDTELWKPLKKHWSGAPEVHFSGCNVAGNETGRQALRRFANDLLPADGFVEANRIQGYGKGGRIFRGALRSNDGITQLVTLVHPAGTETTAFVIIFASTLLQDFDELKNGKTDRIPIVSSVKYRYSPGK